MSVTNTVGVVLQGDGAGVAGAVFGIVYLAVVVLPIYNVYIMIEIGDNEWWWLLVLFVPVVQLYAAYKISKGVADAFGEGIGFALGLMFLAFIFFPLLGFGDYSYQGPSSTGAIA